MVATRFGILLLTIATDLFLPGLVQGKEDEPADSLSLPEVEVSSGRAPRDISSAVPVHTLSAEEIKVSGVTDMADALRRLPGVNIKDYGGAGGLKTVSVRGMGAPHTAVLYDGIPLSDIRSGQIDLSRYSLSGLRQLSLTVGDNADIFVPARAAASAATVALRNTPDIPDDASSRFGLYDIEGHLKFGSWQSVSPFARISLAKSEALIVSMTGEFSHSKNNYPFTLRNGRLVEKHRRNNSRMNSGHGELSLGWNLRPSTTLTAKAYYYDNSRQLPGPVVYYVDTSREHLHDRNFFAQASLRSRLSSQFSLSVMAKYNWATSRYEDVSGVYPGGKLDERYRQREGYASAALLYTPLRWLAADYSADWVYNTLTSNLKTNSFPRRNALLQTLSVKLTPGRFTMLARVLHSYYHNFSRKSPSASESRFSPSVSLGWRVLADEEFFLRASYKDIFRMPTFSELYFDNYGSINLRPEITRQFNLGATYNFTPRTSSPLYMLSATVDVYHNIVTNKIVAIPFNLFRYTMSNLGRARVIGVDLTLSSGTRLSPRHELLVSGSWSWQRAVARTSPEMLDYNKQLAYTPLNSGSLSVTWMNPWANPVVHITGTSARYTTGQNLPGTRIAGYVDMGFSLYRDIPLRRGTLSLRADCINLLDHQYQVIARYPMPGRHFSFTLGYSLR